MDVLDLYQNQAEKRKAYLDEIVKSDHRRKLIVAGPGTGKTFTFGAVFQASTGKANNNLALTFIRNLVRDMDRDFGTHAEVKTFHAYCKKLLHERNGRIELVPYLTKVIADDANLIGNGLAQFDEKFQALAEDSQEIRFYLERGDFYEAVSFDDSVYRLYRYLRDGTFDLPILSQVVVDEFQDFNALEVAFIEELERKSPILIVGDDDQAVYFGRNSSPAHLRKKYHSGKYQVFTLPYCSRCPRVVVEATSAFVQNVIRKGGLKARIARPFIPFLEDKEYENATYPSIVKATVSTIACLSELITAEIRRLPAAEVEKAHAIGYPCVLVVGQKQYLRSIAKKLSKRFSNVEYRESRDPDYSIFDGYQLLRDQDASNLGWRILAQFAFPRRKLRSLVMDTLDGTPMRTVLPPEFIKTHEKVVSILRAKQLAEGERQQLTTILGPAANEVIQHFSPAENETKQEVDRTQPTILLATFQGCKGLSAGHVFIVGLNKGVMPAGATESQVDDVEYCKFIVAMTRTRTRCYLVSNRYDHGPSGRRYSPSAFFGLIPGRFLEDRGYLRSKDISL